MNNEMMQSDGREIDREKGTNERWMLYDNNMRASERAMQWRLHTRWKGEPN